MTHPRENSWLLYKLGEKSDGFGVLVPKSSVEGKLVVFAKNQKGYNFFFLFTFWTKQKKINLSRGIQSPISQWVEIWMFTLRCLVALGENKGPRIENPMHTYKNVVENRRYIYGPHQHHNQSWHVVQQWTTHVESGLNYLIDRSIGPQSWKKTLGLITNPTKLTLKI